MEPASCQRSLTVPGTLSRQIWWSGLEIIGTPPCSVHTAPTARRACGFEMRVPAEPLCHFPKGGMTLSKAATLVGDFPGPNVALNPHLPTVALIQNDAENASPFSAVNDGPGLAERPQLPGRKSRRLQPLRAQRPRRAWPASRQRPVWPEPAAAGGLGLWSWRSEAKAHGFCGVLHQPALGYRGFPQESDGRGGQAQDECDPRVAGRAGNCSPGRAPAARAALQILGRACSSALQIRERSKRVRYTSSLRSSMPKFLLYRYTLHQNRL